MSGAPLDEAAAGLLSVVHGLPLPLTDRQRLVRALDLVASTEWNRVTLRLTAEQITALQLPELLYTPDDLEHVVDVARSVATVYGFERTGVAHIAVALALTSRTRIVTRSDPSLPTSTEVIAEAFGLGTLENVRNAINHYFVERERVSAQVVAGSEINALITRRGARLLRAARAAHLGVRIVAAVLLALLAVRDSVWVWPVAVLALVPSRDPRVRVLRVASDVVVRAVPLPWSLPAVLAVAAGVGGQPVAAWVLVGLLIATEVVVRGGEAVVSRYDRFRDAEFDHCRTNVLRILSLPDGFETYRRWERLLESLWVAVLPTTLVAITVGPTNSAALCVGRRP